MSLPCSSILSPEEIAQYQVRFEEGYDVFDERYQQWMSMYHPDSITPDSPPVDLAHGISPLSSENKKSCSLLRSSVLARLLSEKVPQIKYLTSEHKSCGRVLISSENLLRLEEKKRKKEAELAEKQKKKEEREEKRLKVQMEKEKGKKCLRERA